jgi:VIT1/CCC1 family predicted Fe2+/Mn2+ transporter
MVKSLINILNEYLNSERGKIALILVLRYVLVALATFLAGYGIMIDNSIIEMTIQLILAAITGGVAIGINHKPKE